MALIQSHIYRDQPMKALERAIFWVEYVIRNGGAEHLKSNSIGLNDIQYFVFDASLVILVSIVLTAWFCYLVIIKISTKISNICS